MVVFIRLAVNVKPNRAPAVELEVGSLSTVSRA